MSTDKNALAISLFSEILAADQKVRYRLSSVLPKGMEISHFSVLNHLAWHEGERSPAQLAETFNVRRFQDLLGAASTAKNTHGNYGGFTP